MTISRLEWDVQIQRVSSMLRVMADATKNLKFRATLDMWAVQIDVNMPDDEIEAIVADMHNMRDYAPGSDMLILLNLAIDLLERKVMVV